MKECISIKFYFDSPNDAKDERLGMTHTLLHDSGAENVNQDSRQLEGGVEEVTITAELESDIIYKKHHGFESKLNKAYPQGCGAGYVGPCR